MNEFGEINLQHVIRFDPGEMVLGSFVNFITKGSGVEFRPSAPPQADLAADALRRKSSLWEISF
jgi:hypothetical protein